MEAHDASLGSGDATTRAQELRASLGARQDAEAMVAEASKIRQEAAVAADALVEEAQTLSAQLVRESRQIADETTSEARDRADGILARARIEAEELADRARATADAIRAKAEADVEEHRRRVRVEVTEQVTRELTDKHQREVAAQREQSAALISDLEASVRILSVSLDSARSNVSELLGSLEGLRATSEGAPAHPEPTFPVLDADRPAARPVDQHKVQDEYDGEPAATTAIEPEAVVDEQPLVEEPMVEEPVVEEPVVEEPVVEDRPHVEERDEPSYDVGNPAPATSVPSPVSQFRAESDEEPERPRTATEAFLTSSSLEIEQASRELRDLQHPEDARRRRGEESRKAAQRRELEEGLAEDGDPDPAPDEPARPLGWLFRTAQ